MLELVQKNTALEGDASTSLRELPHNIEAEQALLGALLVDNGALERVSEFLLAPHFFVPIHGRIYDAIVKVVERGQLASPITLKSFFMHDEDLAHVGGGDYLHELAGNAISIVSAPDYARMTYDLALKRDLIRIGEELSSELYRPNLDQNAENYITGTEQKLYELATHGNVNQGFEAFHSAMHKAMETVYSSYKRKGRPIGTATGLQDLDKMLGGFHKSDLIILAGRPGMGKTAIALSIAFNIAKAYKKRTSDELDDGEGGVIGFFSLEMASEQLVLRLLTDVSGVSSEKIRRGEIREEEFKKITDASRQIAEIPIYIDDTPALTMQALRSRARRLKRQHNLSVLMVDYLQLIQGTSNKVENRVQEISEISRGLKALAKELNIPVIALSQLSRAVEQREDKRPQLSDLRESGSIEQDADIVLFLFREDYYLERAQPLRKPDEDEMKFNERLRMHAENLARVANITEVIVAKHRHGAVGKVPVRFNKETTRFENLDHARYRDTP